MDCELGASGILRVKTLPMDVCRYRRSGIFCTWAVILALAGCAARVHAQPRPIQVSPAAQVSPSTGVPSADNPDLGNAAAGSNIPAQVAPTQPPAIDAAAAALGDVNPNSLEARYQQVLARQQQLLADMELAPEIKEQLSKAYEQVRLDLESAQKSRQTRLGFTESTKVAPAALEAARGQKSQDESKKSFDPREGLAYLDFEEMDQLRLSLEAELATVAAERTKLSESVTKREKRRKELPQLASDAKAKLDQLAIQSPTKAPDAPLLDEASQWSLETSKALLTEQLQRYEAEQRYYDAESLLLPMKLELAQTAEKRLQDRVRVVNEQLEKIRSDQIQAKYRQAKEMVAGAPLELKSVGEQLIGRIETWMDLARKHARIKDETTSAQKLLDLWTERRTQMDSRVDPQPSTTGVSNVISGFNSWVGLMLRKQRGELPDPNKLAGNIREYQSEMQIAQSLLFDMEDAQQDLKSRAETLRELNDPSDAFSGNSNGQDKSTELLKFGVEVIQAITVDVNSYLNDLYVVADKRESTIKLTEDYRDFIDKHVLWIRSTAQLTRADWLPGVEAFRWLVSYQNWNAVGQLMVQDAWQQVGWYLVFGLWLLIAFFNQARLRRRLSELSAKAEKNNCVDFRLTARSLLVTFLLTLPMTIGLLFFYWRLQVIASSIPAPALDTKFASALSRGLLLVSSVFFPMELLRQLCRLGGLGIKHFGWREASARRLGKNLRWLIDFTIPLTVIIGIFLAQSDQRWESSLGRMAFIVLMPLLSIFLARVFAPRSGILKDFLSNDPGGWLDRLSVVWYPALIILPMALAVVSFIGYHYTAQRIAFHLVTTLWTIVLVTLAYCLLMRLLVLNRRRLMLAQARTRLEEAARRDPADEMASLSEEPRVDLVAINEQTKRLVNSLVVAASFVLAFVIWSDVLPAVSMLEGVQLWEVQDTVISLANLLMVIPIIVLFIIAGRNVPGLLEIAFLQHLPLTNAARYAITTLSRYAIFAIGIIIVGSTIGLRWTSIQWLVAALGVGLGFGLQEIFANFVSGIILLFEQPIRVGDVVSIDGMTGNVSKIRMRATTIVNWDRQELIVPNKDLITGKLLNWTLSDSTNRLRIDVGVAYGSDTRKACALISQVCKAHPNVLVDPLPSVTFDGFGDNTLNLVVRIFLNSLEHRLITIHELHQGIYEAFRDGGIEIAFPQRDLHIRSLPDSWNRWLERKAPDSTAGKT